MSTITSPVFSEVVVFYQDRDFSGVSSRPRSEPSIYRDMTLIESADEASWHHILFKVFHEMHAVRSFQLVLCADVWDCVGEYAKEVLKEVVAVEKAAGRLYYLSPETPWHHRLFEVFREMYAVRGFRLALCADVLGCVWGYMKGMLKVAVGVEKEPKRFGHLSSDPEPLVVCSPRGYPEEE